MQIKLYNTMSRKIEDFKPLVPGVVSFYSCGPTVYWDQHLGNMRTFLHNDLLVRMFRENGYRVNHVMNYTDVGHLTSDADTGEDKMEKGAAREGKSVWDIADKYIKSVESDMKDLNIIMPKTPRATEYIKEQIELVKKLEDLGYTYIIPGKGVYYDTSRFASYGALSGQDLSKLRAGVRIDDDGKKNPTDFMLWAFSPTDKKREMEWDSPWGRGFPGWHIECSAMSMKLLGNHFDLHTAAQEHIAVHHTNEIAQSEPIVGKPWVNYWVHFAWLMAKDGKMAKSSGESLTVPYIKSKGYDPMAFRYLMLMGHYRSPVEFSWAALDAASAGYKNIVRKVAGLLKDSREAVGEAEKGRESAWGQKMLGAVSDNLKTATALVEFQEMLKDETLSSAEKLSIVKFADDLFGLQFMDRAGKLIEAESVSVPAEIQELAAQRIAAKAAKDWALADELRSKIESAGWRIEDGKDGAKIIPV